MSKIEKLTTQLKNSSFAPKMAKTSIDRRKINKKPTTPKALKRNITNTLYNLRNTRNEPIEEEEKEVNMDVSEEEEKEVNMEVPIEEEEKEVNMEVPIEEEEKEEENTPSWLNIPYNYFSGAIKSVIEYCSLYYYAKEIFDKNQKKEDEINKEKDLIVETNLENKEKEILESIESNEEKITLENRQLARMYTRFIIENKFTSNPYTKQPYVGENIAYKDAVFNYLDYIKVKPEIALCSLLWIDSFHDFKKKRITGQSKVDLNKIINMLSYNVNNKISNIDTLYRDSFFNENHTDFVSNDYLKHTVLAPCWNVEERKFLASILYNLSEKLISDDEFESDLLHTYMMYMFDFKFKDTSNKFNSKLLLDDLKSISLITIPKDMVQYWAKDVDKNVTSSIGGDKVILPASIFDKNTSNSSSTGPNFVNIEETVIPYANGHIFSYSFKKDDCNLTIGYEGNNISGSGYNSSENIASCVSETSDTIKVFDDLLSDLEYALKKDKNKCMKLNKYITSSIKQLSNKELFFNNKRVDLKGQRGFSPKLVIYQIIILLCKKIVTKSKKSLTCAELDFWFSLKRIGDYGQILQCKQLGIPLFTTDKMQILLCLVTRTSSISSIDGWIPVYYNGKEDCFISSDKKCSSIKRKMPYNIDDFLDSKGFSKDYSNDLKRASKIINEKLKEELEGYKVDISNFNKKI